MAQMECFRCIRPKGFGLTGPPCLPNLEVPADGHAHDLQMQFEDALMDPGLRKGWLFGFTTLNGDSLGLPCGHEGFSQAQNASKRIIGGPMPTGECKDFNTGVMLLAHGLEFRVHTKTSNRSLGLQAGKKYNPSALKSSYQLVVPDLLLNLIVLVGAAILRQGFVRSA